jgi:chaperonin cofactor prefoldin
VEWEEQWAERKAQKERMKELEEKQDCELEKTLAENEVAIKELEHLSEDDG